MDLTLTLHLTAGLGALVLGGGVLLREPSRERNRRFALLCGALALWSLGRAGQVALGGGDSTAWKMAYLLGSCAAAPLGLHFVLSLAELPARRQRRITIPFAIAALLLWLSAATPFYDSPRGWPLAAMLVIGGTLATSLWLLGRRALGLAAGPERRAHLLILWGGIVATAGGITDFIPRNGLQLIELGPPAMLIFLVIVCAVVVRHRFLDVDVFLIRAVALLAGAAVAGLVYFLVVRAFGAGFGVLFLASVLVLAIAVPFGRLVLTRARSLLASEEPVARALVEISRALSRVERRQEIRDAIEGGRRLLSGDVRLDVYLRRAEQQRFHLVFRTGDGGAEDAGPPADDDGLAGWLDRERLPVSRRYLERECREADERHAKAAAAALERMVALEMKLVVPLSRGERLAGWIGLGEALSDRDLTAEVAAGLLAVGQQALASLERIEALEAAKRKEALAAVGELAGGLAHEVRNPVAAIRGAAQALGPEATPSQREEMLEVIAEETARLGRFVGEFLEYARPASPRREPVSLAETVRRSLRGLQAAGLKIDTTLEAGDDLPPVAADPDQLHRVCDNLIRNAAEAAGEAARLRIEIHQGDDGRLVARFEDNGPGIPPEEVPLLFQPFHSTKAGGNGLGLALVHRIVEAHGGEIRVEGRPGIGAAFTLVLPEGNETSGDA